MIAKLMASIGLDASEFSSGIKGVETQTQGLESVFGKLKGVIAGAFSVAAVVKFANEFKRAADEIIRAKQEADLTGAGFQALRNSMRDAGQSADSISSALNKLYAASLDAQGGNMKLVGAFDRLGVSVTDLRSLKTDQIFGMIAEAVANTEDKAGTLNAVMDIFGARMVNKVLPALQDVGKEGFDELVRRMERTGRVISDEVLTRVNQMETSWDTLKQKVMAFTGELLRFDEHLDKLLEVTALWIKHSEDAADAIDKETTATLGLEEVQRIQAETARRKAEAEAAAAAAAAAQAAEEEALAKAQDRLDEAFRKSTERQFNALPVKTRLAIVTRELAEAQKDLAEAEEYARTHNATSESTRKYADALDRVNTLLEDKKKLESEDAKETDKAREAAKKKREELEKEAEATAKAKDAYSSYRLELKLANMTKKQQAAFWKESAAGLRAEAATLGDCALKWKLLKAAEEQEQKAKSLVMEETDKANEKLEKSAENLQQLSKFVKQLSEKDYQKLIASLRGLAAIGQTADFSAFRDLQYVTNFRLPANLTRSKILAFLNQLRTLADGTRNIRVNLPDGLAELGRLLDAAGGKAEITITAPPKEALTLQVPDAFGKDIASLAKSAAMLAKLKGVIYA